jgi:hypothetical protein
MITIHFLHKKSCKATHLCHGITGSVIPSCDTTIASPSPIWCVTSRYLSSFEWLADNGSSATKAIKASYSGRCQTTVPTSLCLSKCMPTLGLCMDKVLWNSSMVYTLAARSTWKRCGSCANHPVACIWQGDSTLYHTTPFFCGISQSFLIPLWRYAICNSCRGKIVFQFLYHFMSVNKIASYWEALLYMLVFRCKSSKKVWSASSKLLLI